MTPVFPYKLILLYRFSHRFRIRGRMADDAVSLCVLSALAYGWLISNSTSESMRVWSVQVWVNLLAFYFFYIFWISDYRQRFPLKSTEIWRYRIHRFGVLKFPLSPLHSTYGGTMNFGENPAEPTYECGLRIFRNPSEPTTQRLSPQYGKAEASNGL